MQNSSLIIRPMAPQDARAFLEVHHAAVRETAAKDHPPEVIEAWAPLPIDEAFVEKVRRNLNGDFRVVAEIGGEVIGMAVLVPSKSQVLACYVSPAHIRKGVGSVLMNAIEQEAEDRGLEHLRLSASLTAVAFYKTLRFHERGETEHVFASGVRTTSIKMKKALGAQITQRPIEFWTNDGKNCCDVPLTANRGSNGPP